MTTAENEPSTLSRDARLSILYLGPDNLTSLHRAHAFERLGHRVVIVNPRNAVPDSKLVRYWNHHTGCALLETVFKRRILAMIPDHNFELVFVGAGELVGPSLVQELKRRYGFVIGYNIDDPFGGRDGRRWDLFIRALPQYDLIALVRDPNIEEAINHGARNVLRVWRAADEVAHKPRELTSEDRKTWSSEVSFIGTWMPERGPFLAQLVKLGVPLSIYGNRWQRAAEWPTLKTHWRGPGIHNDEEYAKAVQCSKVCLGLLSKGNRDLTTQRSFEIPYLGTVLCAERTTEHEALYREGEEAVFWSSAEECAEKCLALLRDEPWRRSVAGNGRARCIKNGTTNQLVAEEILMRAGFGLGVGPEVSYRRDS